MGKLSGKIALVTGGTGALGRFVVLRMLQEDATVIVTHRNDAAASKFITETRKVFPKFDQSIADVTSESSVKKLYNDLLGRHSKIHIVCNLVGGVSQKKFIEDISFDEWNRMIMLNLHSCFLMMREALHSMKKQQWGRIINIAAKPAINPDAKRGGYGVAKAGVIALTKTASKEVKEFDDITINAIAPSIILTEENKSWGSEEDFKKWVTPEQIAEMIVYLCSDSGSAINGQVIQMYGKV
jgi:NAD(P)-dependent dehydrogenase (short-subunit alcohol dehydrogenase family)